MHAPASSHCLLLRPQTLTQVAPELQSAYLESEYRLAGNQIVMQIGAPNQALSDLLSQYRVSCAAFVTADNPYSRPASHQENQASLARLTEELDRRRLRWLPGVGAHPRGQWEPEQSVLVLGLGRDGAAELGRRYGQNAVVWTDEDAVPRLLLLR